MKATSHFRAILWFLILGPAAAQIVLPASALERIQHVIRTGDSSALRRLLRENPSAANLRDKEGDTPLAWAAFLGTPAAVEVLLEHDADPNAANDVGATPLIRAATDHDKVVLLLRHGARVDVRTELGNTPLLLAARRFGSAKTIRLLLDHGADVNARNRYGSTALMAACAAADLATVKILVERGAEVNAAPDMSSPGDPIWSGMRTPLSWAALRGNVEIAAYLLDHGADITGSSGFGTPLSQAVWGDSPVMVRFLLERGAPADQTIPFHEFTPLHWAASLDRGPADIVESLLQHGANPAAEGGLPVDAFMGVAQTPLMLARQRGPTPVVELLRQAGAREGGDSGSSPAADSASAGLVRTVREAFAKAIPPLQHSAAFSRESFLRHGSRQNCLSCHQQYLPMAAVGAARQGNLPLDMDAAAAQIGLARVFHGDRELNHEVLFHPEPAIGHGYALLGLHAENQDASPLSDIMVHHLAVIQGEEGDWPVNILRPPIQSSKVTATALAVFSLKHYGWPARAREFDRAVRKARRWLWDVKPAFHEERVFQMLGLSWTGESPRRLSNLARALIKEQRDDGGWGQVAGLPADAYATGQALYALQESAAVESNDIVIRKGRDFLLRTQLNDGTWHVRRRAFPFQPTMDSGFPHGRDSWISAMATSWALLALAPSLEPESISEGLIVSSPVYAGLRQQAAGEIVTAPPSAGAARAVDFVREIQPVLERSCLACHSGDRAKSKYRLETREGLLAAANQGEPSVRPGRGGESPLVHYIAGLEPDMEMPPLGKRDEFPALTAEEIARFRAWIDQGAVWTEDVRLAPANVR